LAAVIINAISRALERCVSSYGA